MLCSEQNLVFYFVSQNSPCQRHMNLMVLQYYQEVYCKQQITETSATELWTSLSVYCW